MPTGRLLVVDLDGTLIRSDMLYETFWSAFASDWTVPFSAAASLLKGRAALKQKMSDLAKVDVTALPYDDAVIDRIRRWREGGGRTVLVTASNQDIAQQIAAHLGLFDEVHGSDNTRNLKGRHKAAFLTERFGDGGFDYMGDSPADLAVWKHAGRAIAVNASAQTRDRLRAMGGDAEFMQTRDTGPGPYFKALRPHQWLKNLLIFLPMLMAHDLSLITVSKSLMAFVVFCMIASGVYVLNDLLDLASDRAHPRKRNRPLASGNMPLSHGTLLAPLLLLHGMLSAIILGPSFIVVMLVYLVTTTAYSLFLKRQLVVDIFTLALLYAVRILAGGGATGIPLSIWLLAFSIFFFFSLAAVKRQAELVDGAANGKITAHGRGYRVDDLPLVANMALGSGYVSVLVMVLYLNTGMVQKLYPSPSWLWGICLVLLYWISRTVMLTHRGQMHDDPVVFAVKDRGSQFCFLLVLGFATAGALL
ncbi:prenyltransferase [Actibacterium sp. EMB200-NS6]|nr:prenyltransferase [Actibacterium sp. EMB200-NS6]